MSKIVKIDVPMWCIRVISHNKQRNMAAVAQSNSLYNLTSYGRGYLITCTDPSACDFYGRAYLTIAQDSQMNRVAYWNDSHSGWIVRGRDVEYAKAFIQYLNDRNAAETLASLAYSGRDEAKVDLSDDEDLITLAKHGRGYLIECNDPSRITWWGEKYIALSEQEDAGVAYWNPTLEAYVVRGRNAEEAEYFVHRANHPKNQNVDAPKTPPRPIRVPRNTPPAPVRKTRTFTQGESQRFTRSVARRLFEEKEDDTSDEEYVPSEEDDESDDDEIYDEEVTSNGPYVGMTLRRARDGSVYMTCGSSHRLFGHAYLGYPPAKMTTRPNCWRVREGTESQFVTGGATYEA